MEVSENFSETTAPDLAWPQRQRGVDCRIGPASRVAYSGGTSSPNSS